MGVHYLYSFFISKLGPSVNVRRLPNGIEGILFDLNGLLHQIAQSTFHYGDKDEAFIAGGPEGQKKAREDAATKTMEELLNDYATKLSTTLSEVITELAPRQYLILAVDGVAPGAKIAQQRTRRYRDYALNPPTEDIAMSVESRLPGGFRTTMISPGTPFMIMVDKIIKTWILRGKKTLPNVIHYSSHASAGEGEHKAFDALRQLFSEGKIRQGKGSHVVYGMDGDLVLLSLLSPVRNMYICREDLNVCVNIDELFLHIKRSMTRDGSAPTAKFSDSALKRDFSVIMSLVGNDFLPATKAINKVAEGPMLQAYTELSEPITRIDDDDGIPYIHVASFAQMFGRIATYEKELLEKAAERETRETGTAKAPIAPSKALLDAYNPKTQNLNLETFRIGWYLEAINYRIRMVNAGGSVSGKALKTLKDELKSINTAPIRIVLDYIGMVEWTLRYYTGGGERINWLYAYRFIHAPLISDIAAVAMEAASKNALITARQLCSEGILGVSPVADGISETEGLHIARGVTPIAPVHQLLTITPPAYMGATIGPVPKIIYLVSERGSLHRIAPRAREIELYSDGKYADYMRIPILPEVNLLDVVLAVEKADADDKTARLEKFYDPKEVTKRAKKAVEIEAEGGKFNRKGKAIPTRDVAPKTALSIVPSRLSIDGGARAEAFVLMPAIYRLLQSAIATGDTDAANKIRATNEGIRTGRSEESRKAASEAISAILKVEQFAGRWTIDVGGGIPDADKAVDSSSDGQQRKLGGMLLAVGSSGAATKKGCFIPLKEDEKDSRIDVGRLRELATQISTAALDDNSNRTTFEVCGKGDGGFGAIDEQSEAEKKDKVAKQWMKAERKRKYKEAEKKAIEARERFEKADKEAKEADEVLTNAIAEGVKVKIDRAKTQADAAKKTADLAETAAIRAETKATKAMEVIQKAGDDEKAIKKADREAAKEAKKADREAAKEAKKADREAAKEAKKKIKKPSKKAIVVIEAEDDDASSSSDDDNEPYESDGQLQESYKKLPGVSFTGRITEAFGGKDAMYALMDDIVGKLDLSDPVEDGAFAVSEIVGGLFSSPAVFKRLIETYTGGDQTAYYNRGQVFVFGPDFEDRNRIISFAGYEGPVVLFHLGSRRYKIEANFISRANPYFSEMIEFDAPSIAFLTEDAIVNWDMNYVTAVRTSEPTVVIAFFRGDSLAAGAASGPAGIRFESRGDGDSDGEKDKERPPPPTRGVLRVGRLGSRGKGVSASPLPGQEDSTVVVNVTSTSAFKFGDGREMKKFTSPFYLRHQPSGAIFENWWQSGKIWKSVHLENPDATEGLRTNEKWQKLHDEILASEKGIRHPHAIDPTLKGRPNLAKYDDTFYKYVASRKLYLEQYIASFVATSSIVIDFFESVLNSGKDLLLLDFDVPSASEAPHGIEVTPKAFVKHLLSPKEPFGHAWSIAAVINKFPNPAEIVNRSISQANDMRPVERVIAKAKKLGKPVTSAQD
jgi:hypothetical protein